MSSNHAKAGRNTEPPSVPSAWRRSPSITARLALLYALLTFAILLTAIVVLYWAVTLSLQHDDQRFLGDKIHVLRAMLGERPDDKDLLREEVDWETRVIGHARYFVQILTLEGKVLTETPGLKDSGIDLAAFPAPISVTSTRPSLRSVRTAGNRRYLLSSAIARTGPHGQQRRIIRLAIDVSNDDGILTDFRHIAALVLLAGVFLSALLGAWVARYGLQPLNHLARTVEATTALKLNQRIEPSLWPGEFVPLANALNRLLRHLEEAFARLSGYAADLAHELRTPINNLMGETEVTLARQRTADDYVRTLSSNLEEYQRLARIIDSLLFLARAENTVIQQSKTQFDAGDAVTEVVEFYRPIAEEAGIALRREGNGQVLADRDLFRRALSNLIDNAIRHSTRGGHIRVSIITGDDRDVHIEVADAGSGIATDERARVFDLFSAVPAVARCPAALA